MRWSATNGISFRGQGEVRTGAQWQGALQPPRATQSSEFQSEHFCTVWDFEGFHRVFKSLFPGPCVAPDSATFHHKKIEFSNRGRIHANMCW